MSAIFVFTTKTTQPHPQVFLVNGSLTCRRLHFWRHFLIKHKILPNLFISYWLWWIKRLLLANQNRGNILNEIIIFFLNITLVLDSLDTLQTCSVLIFLRVPQPCKSVVVINCTTLLIQLFISIYNIHDGFSQHVQYSGRKSENILFIDKFHHHRSKRNADSNAPSCKVNNCTYVKVRFVNMSYSVFIHNSIFWNGSSIS